MMSLGTTTYLIIIISMEPSVTVHRMLLRSGGLVVYTFLSIATIFWAAASLFLALWLHLDTIQALFITIVNGVLFVGIYCHFGVLQTRMNPTHGRFWMSMFNPILILILG